MVLEDEKVSKNKKLKRIENQKVGGSKTCQPSHLLALHLLTFLFSKYLCLFVFIRGFPYPLSPFLFPNFWLNLEEQILNVKNKKSGNK